MLLMVLALVVVAPPYYAYRFVRWIHVGMGQMKKTLIGTSVVVIGIFAFIYGQAIELSEFAASPLLAIIGCSLFYVIVRYGHDEIDIINEITEKQNSAVALYFLAYAAIIAVCMLHL